MEHGKTIGSVDKRRFTFTLWLPIHQGTPIVANTVTYGCTWIIDWRSLIPQDVPVNAKFLVRHTFNEEIEQSTGNPLREAMFITVQGLPGVQNFTPWTTYNPGGQIINMADFRTTAWNTTAFAARYVASEATFVCAHPGQASSAISLSFFDVGNTTNTPLISSIGDGIHMLQFELVSDV